MRHFMETCRGLDKIMLDESENKPHSLYPLLYPVTHIAPGERSIKCCIIIYFLCYTNRNTEIAASYCIYCLYHKVKVD
jgi:hypothetical protein